MKGSARRSTTRDAILDATDKLLAEHGYRKMTIDDLAREVGIGKGSVYLHFSSKEEIALSHIDRMIEQLKTRLRKIAASDASCEVRVRQMLMERVLYRFDSVQHYSQSLNELLGSVRGNLLERRRRYFHEEAQIFAEVIEEGFGLGVFHGEDAFDKADLLLLATNSLLPYSLSTRELGKRAEIGARTEAISTLLLDGLKTR